MLHPHSHTPCCSQQNHLVTLMTKILISTILVACAENKVQCVDSLSVPLPSSSSAGRIPAPPTQQKRTITTTDSMSCSGSWNDAKLSLRSPECCVVYVSGLDIHLQTLQSSIADNGPMDIDLRARIRTGKSTHHHLEEDCLKLQQLVLGEHHDDPAVTAAIMEIASGAASLADGPLEGVCTDVFLRIVCASDYKARDPMFHTDKCPIRGYVTLRGVGTEFRTKTCSPFEYAVLRTLGGNCNDKNKHNDDNLRQAQELELIVMKGDHYRASKVAKEPKWWTRESTCVHRSPQGTGGRRVILSFDLAAGEDDREWFEVNKRREWRSGMTQRKSRLVA